MHLNDPDYSKLRALKLIRRTGGLSRVELAAALGFNRATVTELVAELLRRGVLIEEKIAAQGRGRPRTQLRIDANAGYAISLFPLMNGRATIDIIDLEGALVHSREAVIGPLDDMAALPDIMSRALEATLDDDIVPRDAVRHAAILLPGLVNHRDGVVHWLPSSRTQHDLLLSRLVADRIAMPVSLDNRAAAIARAEHWFGQEGELDDFTLVALLEVGMNAARYVGGHMQLGYNGLNSEFSHVKVAFEGGRPCYCGSSGCLTAYASVSGIASAFAQMRSIVFATFGERMAAFDDAVRMADGGDGEGLALFESGARALGTAMANHINEHDPGRVVIICARSELLRLMTPTFLKTVKAQTLPPIWARTRIDLRLLDEGDYGRGAAALALEGLYRRADA